MPEINIKDKTSNFIFDWKKRSSRQNKIYVVMFIIGIVIAFLICDFMYYWFQKKNYDRVVSLNTNYVQDSAIQATNQIEKELEYAETLIVNFAKRYASWVKYNPELSVKEKLTILSDQNVFDRLAFIAPDGTDTSLEGVAIVYDRQYFKDAMNGNSGYEFVGKSRVTGKSTVIFYSPIILDKEIIGVMAGFYEQNRLEKMFSYELFNYVPDTYLLLGDGTIVANSNNEDISENMLDRLSNKKYIGENDFEDIKKLISDSERTTISFNYKDGSKTKAGVLVQFTKSDWMIFSALPGDITQSMINRADKAGRVMLFAVIFGFAVIIVVMLVFFKKQGNRLNNEMSTATDSLRAAMHEEEKQYNIIESLGNTYSSVYYVDMEKATCQRIKEDVKNVLDSIPGIMDAEEGFSLYINSFVSDEDKDNMKAFLDTGTFRERLAETDPCYIEYKKIDGGWRRAVIVSSGRNDDGEIIAVVFAVQKIDEEKNKEIETAQALREAYEAAKMASNAKTAFLSNMSHDIRTPMNAIVGMTAIATANISNTDKVLDCLKKITSSSKLLLGLINEVLDMSKIESGKVDLCEEEFNLSELIDNLIQINQPLIKEKNHTLMVKINNLNHENVIGDSTRLQQVFTNLLSNAIKYTPEGGKIEIVLSEKENNKQTVGWYEVIFRDNGIGMSDEYIKKLFEPFSRASDDRVNHIQGTGLGMPIAKNIINMMNGDITVKSDVDKGTEFTVSFILKLQKDDEINYDNFVDLPILVADDDIAACESTCTLLNSLSMKSEWVTSGREAVEKVIEHHEKNDDYYAVILDWKMPEMNGVDTAREIRSKIGNDIPIIVISAYDWSDIEEEARKAGVNAFLSKPLFKSRVVGLFNELVGNNMDNSKNIQNNLNNYDFTGSRILLAEDNELNREIAVEILSMTGLKAETAENGKIAVQMFADSAPGYYDLILMDIQMPVMNGYDATREIRGMNRKDAKKIPIVAMTANAFSSDVRDAYSAGMDGHISKPIDINRVVSVLQEKIGGG